MVSPVSCVPPSVITSDGCWADYRTPGDQTHGRACLFLDRDGVLIEDTGYPHVPADVVPIVESLRAAAAAQRSGAVIGIVSNQSGIGRGYFGWDAFAAVQAVIDTELAALDTRLDFVLACPHIPEASLPSLRSDHEWRKPRPGMLLAAAARLGIALDRSAMLGDKASDMAAGERAGVANRWLLDSDPTRDPEGGGARHLTRDALAAYVAASFTEPCTDGR